MKNYCDIELGYVPTLYACRVASMAKTTMYNHIAAGRIRKVKVGGKSYVNRADLLALFGGDDE